MSLFNSSIRPPAILSDQAIERYIASIRTQIDPDPLFRRRLRGIVVGGYVAAREGLAPPSPVRAMGRLGRACLYASFVLGVSVTSVMAASESAVPGDLLYPLKRQIEHLRVEVLPADYHGVLAAHTLTERISELDVLVEREDWVRAGELAPAVAHDLEAIAAAGEPVPAALNPQLAVLEELLVRLPEPARAAIDRAIHASTGTPDPGAPSMPSTSGGAGGPSGSSGGGNGGGGGDRPSPGQPGTTGNGSGGQPSEAGSQGNGRPDPEPTDSPAPDASSASQPTPRAQPSIEPKPSKSPKP